MESLIPANKLETLELSDDDYAIFGGTFDPIHQGHITVVYSLISAFSRVIIAPTERNPWKNERPTPLPLRRAMISQVLHAEGISEASSEEEPGVSISNVSYEYSEELAHHYRQNLSGKLFWAVGSDAAKSISSWKNWEALNIPVIVAPVVIETHATEVRDGSSAAHPALLNFVAEHSLYGSSQ